MFICKLLDLLIRRQWIVHRDRNIADRFRILSDSLKGWNSRKKGWGLVWIINLIFESVFS